MSAYKRLTAFIDWNSQIRLNSTGSSNDPVEKAAFVLSRVGRLVSKALAAQFADSKFLIDLRLYHGWHQGFEPTVNRRALRQAIALADFSALSVRPEVVFSGEADFGDRLAFALQRRIHPKLAIHLPNTLRVQDKRRQPVEKMVDTALAADLVSTAAREPTSWLLVVAEDDDVVPPVFVAEAHLREPDGRVLILRHQLRAGPFLKLDSLLCGVRDESR